jgi:hypothetical protein
MDGARRVLGVLAALGVAATLAACSSGGSDSGNGLTAAEGGAPAAAPPQAGGDAKTSGGGPQQQQQQQQPIDQPGVDRKLIRTATLELASPNAAEVTTKARDVANRMGGFSGQEDLRGDSATLTLHIPSDQFDKALSELSDLVPDDGVVARSQTAQDVTEQLVDVESRINTQKQSVERVRALLARAQTVGEIVQIEGEVTRREADLESLQKRRETLTGQVAMSKVTLKVTKSARPAEPEEDDGLLAGLVGGWKAFLTAGGWLINVLGAMLPFVIVLGIPGFLALRWWARRRRVLSPQPNP